MQSHGSEQAVLTFLSQDIVVIADGLNIVKME